MRMIESLNRRGRDSLVYYLINDVWDDRVMCNKLRGLGLDDRDEGVTAGIRRLGA